MRDGSRYCFEFMKGRDCEKNLYVRHADQFPSQTRTFPLLLRCYLPFAPFESTYIRHRSYTRCMLLCARTSPPPVPRRVKCVHAQRPYRTHIRESEQAHRDGENTSVKARSLAIESLLISHFTLSSCASSRVSTLSLSFAPIAPLPYIHTGAHTQPKGAAVSFLRTVGLLTCR